jgi:hypothetical protein
MRSGYFASWETDALPGKGKGAAASTGKALAGHPRLFSRKRGGGKADWQVFWLVQHRRPSHSESYSGMFSGAGAELTAAGTASDLHRIPF